MTVSCKTVVYSIGLFSLLFIAIPVSVDPPEAEVERHFIQFIQQHNKSYGKNSPEYAKRFENFKVSTMLLPAFAVTQSNF